MQWEMQKISTLTSSSLINTIQTNNLAFLRKAYKSKQNIELIAVHCDFATTRSNKRHDPSLRISTESCICKELRNASSIHLASAPILANHRIKRLDVGIGDIDAGEEVADQIPAALLFARRGHIPRGLVAAAVVVGEEARGSFGERVVIEEGACTGFRTTQRGRHRGLVLCRR